jgi:TRAP transporter TAXI family solute receptor
MVMSASDTHGLTLGVAGDKNITTYAELKGKRVAFIKNADALNVGTEAMLACGGLTWNDVQKVEFPSSAAAWEGIAKDQVDAMFGSTITTSAKVVHDSPRGLYWPPTLADDVNCWAGIKRVAPYFIPKTVTAGFAISPEKPLESSAYPYPILMTLGNRDKNEVYSLARAMTEGFDTYSKYDVTVISLKGWAMKSQLFDWVMPYHEGAIAYFKEAGVWTPKHQAHNDRLVERQRILGDAWAKLDKSGSGEEFTKKWMTARADALLGAGFDPIW